MEVYMRQRTNKDYLTVAIKKPDDQKIQLFPNELLYWMRPGKLMFVEICCFVSFVFNLSFL